MGHLPLVKKCLPVIRICAAVISDISPTTAVEQPQAFFAALKSLSLTNLQVKKHLVRPLCEVRWLVDPERVDPPD